MALISKDRVRLKRLLSEVSWIVAGQIASVLGSLLLVRVLTEYLSPAQYGEMALGLTIAGLVNQVVMGGLNNGIGRFYPIAVENGDLSGYLKASRRLMGYAALAVGLISIVLLAGLLWADQTQWFGLTVAVVVLSVLDGFNSSLSGIQNAARQRSIVALHSGMNAWLKVGLALVLILLLGTSSVVVVFGFAFSALLITASQLFFLKRLITKQTHPNLELANENWELRIWAYARPFSVFGIFTWTQLASDRWALQSFAATQDVGQYMVVFQLGYTPIVLVTGLAMSFLGPILYQRSGVALDPSRNASVHRLAWRITGVSLAVTGLAFLFTLLLNDWLFQHLVALPFRAASYLLPWFVLSGGIFAAGQMLSLKLMSDMNVSAMTTTKIVSALLGIGFNVAGAWCFGLNGVVAGLVAFSILYFVWMAWVATHYKTDGFFGKTGT